MWFQPLVCLDSVIANATSGYHLEQTNSQMLCDQQRLSACTHTGFPDQHDWYAVFMQQANFKNTTQKQVYTTKALLRFMEVAYGACAAAGHCTTLYYSGKSRPHASSCFEVAEPLCYARSMRGSKVTLTFAVIDMLFLLRHALKVCGWGPYLSVHVGCWMACAVPST